VGWIANIHDLTAEFISSNAPLPARPSVVSAARECKFDVLDDLYFAWEDQICGDRKSGCHTDGFGLLSGYPLAEYRTLPLREALNRLSEGTPFTSFINSYVLSQLRQGAPDVIGVTIASGHQVIPATELLVTIRRLLPDSLLVLGGNVVTRLRGTPAFDVLTGLADHTVLFQGEAAFFKVLTTVQQLGLRQARNSLPSASGDEQIPHECWPTPSFDGIDFGRYVGIPCLSYVSTRGCYWGRCHFCAIPAGWSSSGYGGSAPADVVFKQLADMFAETGIPRIKFVDEALPPAKIAPLAKLIVESGTPIEWEAYARLEPAFENATFLEYAYAGGLRKLYFGLEQAPTTNRLVLNKNDRADPMRVLRACKYAGIKVHLFCMVGHPGTSRGDAEATTRFLIENQGLIDTADLVGFRLDRGTTVPGVRAAPDSASDWAMSSPFVPVDDGILGYEEVQEMESVCQEALWEAVPRLLHPLYRVVGPWTTHSAEMTVNPLTTRERDGQPALT
jgi:hypothetical protein